MQREKLWNAVLFLEYGFDGVVASAGGYILCGENVIYDCPMTDAQRIKTMDTLTESGLCWIAECRDEAYASDSFKAFVEKDVDEQVSSEFLRWREFVKKDFFYSFYRGIQKSAGL